MIQLSVRLEGHVFYLMDEGYRDTWLGSPKRAKYVLKSILAVRLKETGNSLRYDAFAVGDHRAYKDVCEVLLKSVKSQYINKWGRI